MRVPCKIYSKKKTLGKYGTTGQTLTVVDVFDRRADHTKGATEQSRGDSPPTALDFTANDEVDLSEKITNYSSQWKDREYGRKKITTAYCHFFKKPNNINKIGMCGRVQHIVVADDGGSCTAYELSNKDVTYLNEN